MPIYEYKCTSCHQQFELVQKISEAPATKCPQCFKDTVVRLISATGFQLKGDGWYVTDFKNKPTDPKKNANKTENSTKPVEAQKTTSSSDSNKKS